MSLGERATLAVTGERLPGERSQERPNRDLAAAAGRKGGSNIPAEKRAFSQDRELASAAGRVGGSAKRAAP